MLRHRLKLYPKAAHRHEVQIEVMHSEGEGIRGAEKEAGAAAEGSDAGGDADGDVDGGADRDADGGRGRGECGGRKGGGEDVRGLAEGLVRIFTEQRRRRRRAWMGSRII